LNGNDPKVIGGHMMVYVFISIGSIYLVAIVAQLLACAAAVKQVDIENAERSDESDRLSPEPL
jgi:hypothetical protein